MEITQAGENVSILLTPEQGELLRRLIERNIIMGFSSYIQSIGMVPSNIYSILDGRRKLTQKTLEKLLAGTKLETECHITITVKNQSGHHVPDVGYRKEEPQSYLEERDEYERDA